jgi:2-polyprenyl-3-methyl-5-hydroxy-6-metoxy-1,4-benzoquinol methylase
MSFPTEQPNQAVPSCPACGSKATGVEARSVMDEYGVQRGYHRCADCGHVWLFPMPAAAELEAYYQDNYYGTYDTKFPRWIEYGIGWFRRRRALRVARSCPAGAPRILDIGCGSGAFLQAIGREGIEMVGIELPGRAADRAAQIPGMRLHTGALETLSADWGPFGAITLWHVFEHMGDPGAILEKIHGQLSPKGRLYIDVPNGDSWQAKLFGVHWFHRDPPRHLHQFTPSSIKSCLEAHGFTCISIVSRQEEMGFYGILQSLSDKVIHPRSCLYNLLRKRERCDLAPLSITLAVLAGILFSPPALLLAIFEACTGRAAVLSVIAVGEQT